MGFNVKNTKIYNGCRNAKYPVILILRFIFYIIVFNEVFFYFLGFHFGICFGCARKASFSRHSSLAFSFGSKIRANAEKYFHHNHSTALGNEHSGFTENEQASIQNSFQLIIGFKTLT